MEERQDIYTSKSKEVKHGNYYPCQIEWISDDKTRLVIRFGKWRWEVPASSVRDIVQSDF